MTEASTSDRTDHEGSSGRRWLPIVLVVVATIVAVLSATTTWVRAQALDTDAWVESSGDLLAEPEVREALANYLVDELYRSGEVAEAIERGLPDELDGLAGVLAGALRGPATDAIELVLERPELQQAWTEANRLAHGTLVAIVRDDVGDNVSTAGGAVVLDLAGAVRVVGERLGLSDDLLDRLPADAGQVTIFESDELGDVQEAVRLLDLLSWFLFVVVVGLYAAAVYLARGRRRETLRDVGVAVVVAGVVVLALRTIAIRVAVESVVEVPINRPVARLAGEVMTQMLGGMAWTAILVGALIVGFTALVGPHRYATAVRGRLAATSNTNAVVAGVAIAVLLLVAWWSPGRLFARWETSLTLLAMLVGAGVVLARTLEAERSADAALSTPGAAASDDLPVQD